MLVSLVFMAGAAGRGQDINEVYIIPHFVHDFHLDITRAAFLFSSMQMGSLIGPLCLGLDLRSLQSQAGYPGFAFYIGLMHALARMARNGLCRSVRQFSGLRRGRHFASDVYPGFARRPGRRRALRRRL